MGRFIVSDFEGVVMAGQSRTLKLSILADVDQLKKSLNTANNDVDNSSSKMGDFSKKAGLAFAAVGIAAAAYASKLLIDGVKSAIADEAAQAKLATTLKNVTGATDDQIAATEKYILKTSLANGITDDQLRPSLERLTRATKDVGEAQRLQTLALDIAAGTGKSLEAVSNALGKAYEGNTGALGKLGVGLDKTQIKSMSLDEITKSLADTFGGQATEKADTFAGKMLRLNVAFDEGKETVGSFVLDAITPMVDIFVKDVVPAIAAFAEEIGPKLEPIITFLGDYINDVLVPAFKKIWAFITDFLIPTFENVLTPIIDGLRKAFEKVQKAVNDNSEELKPFIDLMKKVADFIRDTLAPILGGAFKIALNVVAGIISGLVNGFAGLVSGITNTINAVKAFIKFMTDNPITQFFAAAASTITGKSKGLVAGGDLSTGDLSGLSGSTGGMTVTGSGSVAELRALENAQNAPIINVTVNGAIDPEGTSRTIVDTLNDSFFRGTGGAMNLQLA